MPAAPEQDVNRQQRPRFTIGSAPPAQVIPSDVSVFRGGEPQDDVSVPALVGRIRRGEIPGLSTGLSKPILDVVTGAKPPVQTLPDIISAVINAPRPPVTAPNNDPYGLRADLRRRGAALGELFGGVQLPSIADILRCIENPVSKRCKAILKRLGANKSNQFLVQLLLIETGAALIGRLGGMARGLLPRGGAAPGKPSPSTPPGAPPARPVTPELKSLKDKIAGLQKRVVGVPGRARVTARPGVGTKVAPKPAGRMRPGMTPARAPIPTKSPAARPAPAVPRTFCQRHPWMCKGLLGTAAVAPLILARTSRSRVRRGLITPLLPRSAPATIPAVSLAPAVDPITAQARQISRALQLAPAFSLQPGLAGRSTTATRRCLERKRKPGKCAEGYFKETPSRTTYKVWRERDCFSRKVTKRSKS